MDFLPFDIPELNEEILSKAEEELGETSDIRRETLLEMRKAVKEDTSLYCTTDDDYLIQYLRARKFNVKNAVTLLKRYYDVKKTYKDVYGEANFGNFTNPIRRKIVSVLPYRNRDGSVILLVDLNKWKSNEMKFQVIVHSVTCSLLACIKVHPATQIYGFTIIFDIKEIGIRDARSMSVRLIHLAAKGISNILPIRTKAVHVINYSQIVQYLWNFLKQFLTEKIRKRAFYHTSKEGLAKVIDPAILPEVYGGRLKYDNSFWVETVENLQDYYFALMSYGFR